MLPQKLERNKPDLSKDLTVYYSQTVRILFPIAISRLKKFSALSFSIKSIEHFYV